MALAGNKFPHLTAGAGGHFSSNINMYASLTHYKGHRGHGLPTVGEDEEDEGSVPEQPQDGGRVGILLWGHVPGSGLGLSRGQLRALLED